MTDVTTPRGEVLRHPGGRRLVFRRSYSRPIGDVWSALTDPERLARWFGSYDGVGITGGSVALTMTAEEDAVGEPATVRIIECAAPSRLAVEITHATAAQPWRISLTLAEASGKTVLVFEQAMPPELSTADVGPGWHWYLDRLAASLAGAPMPAWEGYPALAAAYT